jgi:hypothetical protein
MPQLDWKRIIKGNSVIAIGHSVQMITLHSRVRVSFNKYNKTKKKNYEGAMGCDSVREEKGANS